MAHPQETKNQAVALYAGGLSPTEIGRLLGLRKQTIHRWVTPKGQASVQAQAQDPGYRERQRESSRARYADPGSGERMREYMKEYRKAYEADPEVKERKNRRDRERWATDPAYRALRLLRTRTWQALKGNTIKSASTEKLLGISALKLTQRWDVEYGLGWSDVDLHIDHIRPCSSFDLANPSQQQLCFNYRNLQLLPMAENLSKGDQWTEEMQFTWVGRMRHLGWEGPCYCVDFSEGRQ